MLNRIQPIASNDEPETQFHPAPEAEKPAEGGAERRRHPRVALEATPADEDWATVVREERRNSDRRSANPSAYSGPERRSGERRGMNGLNADMQWKLAPETENKILGAMRNRVPHRWSIKPARIALLGVAVLAGGMAAFLATQRVPAVPEATTEPTAEIVQVATTQILVAKEPIGIGQRLSASSVEWQDWPLSAVRPQHITVEASPDALTDMAGAVARYEIIPGEPVLQQKLVQADQGYLSAVLNKSMRGVSVSVSAESASGGFIVPNDHVDVVSTRTTDAGQVSKTIVRNVRVLAINSRLGETGKTGTTENSEDPQNGMFSNQAIATLELDAAQAEVLIGAGMAGSISLVLRSMVDFAEVGRAEQSGANQAIRLSSPFWAE